MSETIFKKNLKASVSLKQEMLEDQALLKELMNVSDLIIAAYRAHKKVLFCGNGGSAADAQHLAAEFSGRYYYDRPPLNAEALHVNGSYVTAVANDYSFEDIFSRMINAIGQEKDVLIALSTSGNSANVVNAVLAAKEKGLKTVGLTGKGGGQMKELCDFLIEINSTDTPRIQECHMLIGHSICEIVEQTLFPK